MAQYIALSASLFSLIGSALKKKDPSGTGTRTRVVTGSSLGFSTGLATGLALGIVIVNQFRRRRIKERIRHTFYTWLNGEDDNDDNDNEQSGTQSPFPSCIGPSSLGEDSIIEVIANGNNTLTSNLSCSKITMKKGTRIAYQRSNGVEVYYILKGTADFMMKENEEKSSTISVKESKSFVLNPWTTRSIANNSHDDLIMIRISDAGDDEHPNSGYLVVEKIDHQGAIRTITNGINGIFNAKWGIQI